MKTFVKVSPSAMVATLSC